MTSENGAHLFWLRHRKTSFWTIEKIFRFTRFTTFINKILLILKFYWNFIANLPISREFILLIVSGFLTSERSSSTPLPMWDKNLKIREIKSLRKIRYVLIRENGSRESLKFLPRYTLKLLSRCILCVICCFTLLCLLVSSWYFFLFL